MTSKKKIKKVKYSKYINSCFYSFSNFSLLCFNTLLLFKTYCLYFGIGGFLNGVKKQFQTNGWLFDIKMSCITVNCNRSVSISFPSISTVYKNSKSSCKLFMKKKKKSLNVFVFYFFESPSTFHSTHINTKSEIVIFYKVSTKLFMIKKPV